MSEIGCNLGAIFNLSLRYLEMADGLKNLSYLQC
jgi:hypothetical protein